MPGERQRNVKRVNSPSGLAVSSSGGRPTGASVWRRGRSSGHRQLHEREGRSVRLQEPQRCKSELRLQACLSAPNKKPPNAAGTLGADWTEELRA